MIPLDALRSKEASLDPDRYAHDPKSDGLIAPLSHTHTHTHTHAHPQSSRSGLMAVLCGQWRAGVRVKALMPSFVVAAGRKQHVVVRSLLKDTAYMDGLRGIACYCVFIGHVFRPWASYPSDTDSWDFGFGVNNSHSPINLPVIRSIYSGTFMVQIFFVLSGYVLSLKPLSLIRTHTTDSLLDYLSAAVFRRAFRLYLPIFVARIFVSVIVYSGNFGHDFIGTTFQDPKGGLWAQIVDYFTTIFWELNPFRWDRQEPPYMPQLWTIPVEFRGSLIVYLTLLAFAKIKPVIRLSFLVLFTLYCLSVKMVDMADFTAGMFLAECALIRKDASLDMTSLLSSYATSRTIQRSRAIFWSACAFIALWLGTYPLREGQDTWGYQLYSTLLIPSTYQESDWSRAQFSIFVASTLLLASLENFKPLQRPFTTVIAQYLGKISFALYVVHQPMAYSFNRELARAVFMVIPSHAVAYAVAMTLVSATTVWAADVFWRLVDVKSINAARVVRKWCES